jgi:hypothetical protein
MTDPEPTKSWNMHAHKHENGELWGAGQEWWVRLFFTSDPIVPVCVEELDIDPTAPEVTHYGWRDLPLNRQTENIEPSMIYPRCEPDSKRGITPWFLLGMCFTYGMKAETDAGKGRMVCLRITEVA